MVQTAGTGRLDPRYPVYVVSKGRWETRLTARALDSMRVEYRIVVEPPEYDKYAAVIEPRKILTLPFADVGCSVPARNWIWQHAIDSGAKRHWIIDDNIYGFSHFNRHRRYDYLTDGSGFYWIEQFVDAYANVAIAGMQYAFLVKQGGIDRPWRKPFALNTRIYSCMLILNSLPFRWRGRYDEDTDLSLRVLKAGWVTLLSYAFICKKAGTMLIKGGNTDELYKHDAAFDGRLAMAEHLQRQHPDVVRIIRRYGRWQKLVNYKPFAGNKLLRVSP